MRRLSAPDSVVCGAPTVEVALERDRWQSTEEGECSVEDPPMASAAARGVCAFQSD